MPRPKPGSPLPFSEAENFRELGGWPAAQGRRVRRGLFYRSGALGAIATPEDRALFQSLGIRRIFDFRSKTERRLLPDPPFAGAEYVAASALFDDAGQELDFSPGSLPPAGEMVAAMLHPQQEDFLSGCYRLLPLDNPAYRALFRAVQQGETPLLFHCSAGKDRTGIAAALLLLALGASRSTVVKEYMLTNQCRPRALARFEERNAAYLTAHPEYRELLMGIEGVSRRNIELSLRAIDARYPTLEEYFADQFGLDRAELERLRERYLEPGAAAES